jgi:hypothetical protein
MPLIIPFILVDSNTLNSTMDKESNNNNNNNFPDFSIFSDFFLIILLNSFPFT